MKNGSAWKLAGAAIFLMLCAGSPNLAAAQGAPQILMNWQADTYVPSGFRGKIMPVSDSMITVGLDLFSGGKRVDLSAYKVLWYIDDKFYLGGTGLNRVSFKAPHFIGETSVDVRALVSDYGAGIGKTVTIPIVLPEAVIQSSSPSLAASTAPFNLQAYPYFFNVRDMSQLSFSWSLNGVNSGSQNPFTVTKDMADRGSAILELSVRNPARPIERTTQQITILR